MLYIILCTCTYAAAYSLARKQHLLFTQMISSKDQRLFHNCTMSGYPGYFNVQNQGPEKQLANSPRSNLKPYNYQMITFSSAVSLKNVVVCVCACEGRVPAFF